VDFFVQKIGQLLLRLNPLSWAPEASMLTTRPSKPLWKTEQLLSFTVAATDYRVMQHHVPEV
jgi:hypothetical protein